MPYHIEKLLKFLRHHGVDCHYTKSGKLMVEDVYYQTGADALIDIGTHREWIEIEATPKSVREFLGY